MIFDNFKKIIALFGPYLLTGTFLSYIVRDKIANEVVNSLYKSKN